MYILDSLQTVYILFTIVDFIFILYVRYSVMDLYFICIDYPRLSYLVTDCS